MTGHRWPVDSQDAAELREREDDDQPTLHDARCEAGWLGEDDQDRPIPCLACRPHLARDHGSVNNP